MVGGKADMGSLPGIVINIIKSNSAKGHCCSLYYVKSSGARMYGGW